eukprot:2285866-Alexandrium_andersonii.AAC.1
MRARRAVPLCGSAPLRGRVSAFMRARWAVAPAEARQGSGPAGSPRQGDASSGLVGLDRPNENVDH